MTRKDLAKLIIDDPESEVNINIDTYKHIIQIEVLSENKKCYKFEKLLDNLDI